MRRFRIVLKGIIFFLVILNLTGCTSIFYEKVNLTCITYPTKTHAAAKCNNDLYILDGEPLVSRWSVNELNRKITLSGYLKIRKYKIPPEIRNDTIEFRASSNIRGKKEIIPNEF